MDANKIEELMEKTWKELCETFDRKAFEYSKSLPNLKQAKEAHWLFWNEFDLKVHLAQSFYKQLGDNPFDIQMHFDVNLKPDNFKDYNFKDKLKELKEYPKADLIITPEKSLGPFLMYAEAKCFHASEESISHNTRTAEGVIEKDIKTLTAIKELGIAEKVAFIFFDDYYYLEESDKSKQICKKLDEI